MLVKLLLFLDLSRTYIIHELHRVIRTTRCFCGIFGESELYFLMATISIGCYIGSASEVEALSVDGTLEYFNIIISLQIDYDIEFVNSSINQNV